MNPKTINMKKNLLLFLSLVFFLGNIFQSKAQTTSIAQFWSMQLLKSIRKDFARPPVHARNLYHISIAMHDAWAVYSPNAETYFLGKNVNGFTAAFLGVPPPADIEAARKMAISYAAYRLIKHRFALAPGLAVITANINHQMDSLGYDINYTAIDYANGNPAALGNYIANRIIAYGYQDGSNEINNYAYQYYQPVNPKILVEQPGNPSMINPNRWQAISLSVAIDQSGNLLTSDPPHLGPEWGNVKPFCMTPSDVTTHVRDGNTYKVYHDQGDPAYIDTTNGGGLDDFYRWNFSLVSVWQSHLDTTDGVMWDISPASQGNVNTLPNTWTDYQNFYDYFNGGDPGVGHAVNPVTGLPYTPQMVKRGDYARVLAEFWADGLDSETPPGHWFEIYNHVSDNPLFIKKWAGQGPVLDDLEYDVKAYLTLGGSMHDAAISAWSHKGWYDYVRPVSAIRYMADHGQSSDSLLPNYSKKGIPLVPGFIELVQAGDSLAGAANEHVGKIKLYTWKGPGYISNPLTDMAGVGWILAENWWPYQRPTFVTPPFAGYISGHSTFSRTAAEVMTAITGDAFFPGGMSNFVAPQNEFLKFEEGPTQDIILQWATYRDASDQCSLSRIWGGIHPPMDDISGRKIGIELGAEAFTLANNLFTSQRPNVSAVSPSLNVVSTANIGDTISISVTYSELMDTLINPTTTFLNSYHPLINSLSLINSGWENQTTFKLYYLISAYSETINNVTIQFKDAKNLAGKTQNPYISLQPFRIDKNNPLVSLCTLNTTLINDNSVANSLIIDIKYNELCDINSMPSIQFISSANLTNTLTLNATQSMWLNDTIYRAVYDVLDNNEIIDSIGIIILNAADLANNNQVIYNDSVLFKIDTRNPVLVNVTLNDNLLTVNDIGSQALEINLTFDKAMETSIIPSINFTTPTLLGSTLTLNSINTFWIDSLNCKLSFNLQNVIEENFNIGITINDLKDQSGNSPSVLQIDSLFSIDTKRPIATLYAPSAVIIADASVGTGGFYVDITYSEKMNTNQLPVVELLNNGVILNDAAYSIFTSSWLNDTTFHALFNVIDNNIEISDLSLEINFGQDFSGNGQTIVTASDWIDFDTKNPSLSVLSANTYVVDASSSNFQLIAIFDEAIDASTTPIFNFVASQNIGSIITVNSGSSNWLNSFTYKSVYDVQTITFNEPNIDIETQQVFDLAGNPVVPMVYNDYFDIFYDPLQVNALKDKNKSFIYPNPNEGNGILNFVLEDGSEVISNLLVYSSDGKLVYNESISNVNNGVQSINLPNLTAGIYFIIAQTNKSQKEWKLIVKK
jgi:hypothetical protein